MADKLFTDVRSRTMAMRENQHDGDSGEIVVENPRRPAPSLAPLAITRPAANAKPATAKPVAASQASPKPVVMKLVPVAATRTPTGSKTILTKTDSGNVTGMVKKFQDNTAGSVPIVVHKAPLTAKLSGDKDKKPPAPYVPTKSDEERRKKDAAKLTKEMKMAKDVTSSRASEAKGKVFEVHLHQKKLDTAPPPRPADQKDSSRAPNKLQARNLPSLPKSPEVESAGYDVAYTAPNDSEYSETYAEISQTSCAVNPSDDSCDSYTYAEVGKAAAAAATTTRGDMKMSSVIADMSRNRGRAPAAVPKGGSGDTYDFLDFAGVANAPKDTDQSSGNIYGHLSTVVATEDEDGYADPVFLKETRSQKNSKN